MHPALAGLQLGVAVTFMVGPVCVAIINEAAERGILAGLSAASGAWVGDLILITAVFLGLAALMESAGYRGLTGGAAVVILGGFGVVGIRQGLVERDEPFAGEPAGKGRLAFLKGLSLTLISPFAPVFWIGVFSAVSHAGFEPHEVRTFVLVALLTIIAGDLVKISLARRVRERLGPLYVKIFRVGAGVLFLLMALVVLLRTYWM